MANENYHPGDTGKVLPFTGASHAGGGTSGGDGLEARIAKLEAGVAHLERDVSELRTDMRDVRDRMTRVEAKLGELPSKAFVFGAYGIIGALIVAVTLFQTQIQQVVGIATGKP